MKHGSRPDRLSVPVFRTGLRITLACLSMVVAGCVSLAPVASPAGRETGGAAQPLTATRAPATSGAPAPRPTITLSPSPGVTGTPPNTPIPAEQAAGWDLPIYPGCRPGLEGLELSLPLGTTVVSKPCPINGFQLPLVLRYYLEKLGSAGWQFEGQAGTGVKLGLWTKEVGDIVRLAAVGFAGAEGDMALLLIWGGETQQANYTPNPAAAPGELLTPAPPVTPPQTLSAVERPAEAITPGNATRVAEVGRWTLAGRPLIWSPDGSTAAVALGGQVLLVDMIAGRVLRSLNQEQLNPDQGAYLAYRPDGKALAIADGWQARVWNVAGEQEPVDVPVSAACFPAQVAYSPDGALLALHCAWDGEIRLFDAASMRETGRVPVAGLGTTDPAQSLFWLAGGSTLISGHWTAIRTWQAPEGRWAPESSQAAWMVEGLPMTEDLAVSADGRRVARKNNTASASGADAAEKSKEVSVIGLWEAAGGTLLRNLPLPEGVYARFPALSPDGSILAVIHQRGGLPGIVEYELGIWDVETGQLVGTLKGLVSPQGPASFSPDGRLLALPMSGGIAFFGVAP